MRYLRLALILALGAAGTLSSPARPRPAHPLTMAAVEGRNETAAPGFSGQVRAARCTADFLADALLLSYAQRLAVEASTVAERQALALAATPDDLALAQQQYLQAVRQVLAVSQLNAYAALRQQRAGTLQPLDGTELAVR